MKLKIVSTLAVALYLLLAQGNAFAVPFQRTHASACVQSDESAGIISRSEYRITNIGSSNATVYCP